MSLKKRLVSGAAALALVGTAAMAVNIAQDGTGDYLIAPVYVANTAGWETNIKVVNTNTTKAVVAKVVIRDGATSKEVLDFPIYLTPGDVWTATLYNDNGTVKIKSDDDSLMLGMVQATTACDDGTLNIIKPVQVGIDKALNTPEGAVVTKGYVEVFGLAEYDAAEIATKFGVTWSEGCDLNKTWLYTAARDYNNPDDLNTEFVAAADVVDSDLMGEQVIYNETGASANDMRFMKLNMMALEGVASAPKTDNVLGTDTVFANVADITEGDYKTAMLKQHVFVMYDGDGENVAPFQTIFTFPYMKNVTAGAIDTYRIGTDEIIFRDNEEHAKACNVPSGACITAPCTQPEVNPTDPNSDLSGETPPPPETCPENEYTDEVQVVTNYNNAYAFKVGGYVDIDLSDVNVTYSDDTNATLTSLPVIPTTMSAKKVGGIYLNNHVYNQYAGPSAE